MRAADAGMYVSKHAGGNRVSTAEEPGHDQGSSIRRRLVSGYIEGFLQRERNGSLRVEGWSAPCASINPGPTRRTFPSCETRLRPWPAPPESRELNVAGHGDAVAQSSEVIARSLGLPSGASPRIGQRRCTMWESCSFPSVF